MAMPATPASSRADLVYRRLRADILNGRLKPGSPLRMGALCEAYQVSSGVLREALPRLVGQGLAVSVPQQGYRVVSVSAGDLVHLTEARSAIETQVLRQSMQSGGIEWESDVLAVGHLLDNTPYLTADGDINEEWQEVHGRFHSTLLSGCPNPHLRAIAASLRDFAEVYLSWSRRPGEAQSRDIDAEHRAIGEGVLAHDVDGAVAALKRHIELTTQLLI
jgi:DNA-binding GntR family transcriptional regulator